MFFQFAALLPGVCATFKLSRTNQWSVGIVIFSGVEEKLRLPNLTKHFEQQKNNKSTFVHCVHTSGN
jgi:hypothetical protein